VSIDTTGFVGQDYDRVRSLLEGRGLTVTRAEAPRALLADLGRRLDADAVAGSDPANTTVPVGSDVTLYVASDGYAPSTRTNGSGGGQPQQTTSSTSSPSSSTTAPTATTTHSTTTSAPTSSTATPTTESPLPGTSVSEPPPVGGGGETVGQASPSATGVQGEAG